MHGSKYRILRLGDNNKSNRKGLFLVTKTVNDENILFLGPTVVSR